MSKHLLQLALWFFITLALGRSAPADAQFMFLDVDGDGVYTSSDSWTFLSYDTATVDVYLVTNRDRFGVPVYGGADAGPGLRGYTVNMYSIDAPFSVLAVSNRMPGMSETVPLVSYPYAFTVGYSGGRTFDPGKYLLMSVTLKRLPTRLSPGCGTLSFVPYNCYSPPGVITGFESDLAGHGEDGLLRYGDDWSDAGDLGICTDETGRTPTLSCASDVTVHEGQPVSFRATVTDPDCWVHSFGSYAVPTGASVSGPSPFVNGESFRTFTWTPSPGQAGVYPITFDVYDPDPFNIYLDRSSRCTTQITVLPAQVQHEARIFTTASNRSTRIPFGKPSTCFQLESTDGSFAPADIVASSIHLHYTSRTCGDHDIVGGATKTVTIGDTDANGVSEFPACFDLSALLLCIGNGTSVLPLELTASLINGDLVHGTVLQSFVRTGPALASIAPNPITTASAVEFTTSQRGFARVQVFDVQGRKVASTVDVSYLESGYHRFPLAAAGVIDRLASGVYFVRVSTEHDGYETRAVMLVR